MTRQARWRCHTSAATFAARVAALDAAALVRAVWPHILEAALAGLEPFTLEVAP